MVEEEEKKERQELTLATAEFLKPNPREAVRGRLNRESYAEIAKRLDVKEETARSYIHRVVSRIKALIKEHGPDLIPMAREERKSESGRSANAARQEKSEPLKNASNCNVYAAQSYNVMNADEAFGFGKRGRGKIVNERRKTTRRNGAARLLPKIRDWSGASAQTTAAADNHARTDAQRNTNRFGRPNGAAKQNTERNRRMKRTLNALTTKIAGRSKPLLDENGNVIWGKEAVEVQAYVHADVADDGGTQHKARAYARALTVGRKRSDKKAKAPEGKGGKVKEHNHEK